jgi:ubiquinone/menaquinone biosynthesis C-methylase UbiE
MTDVSARNVFWDIHSDLPRQGPGNRACTQRALDLAGLTAGDPRVLDIACGPGMQTLDLAELLPGASIVAVDRQIDFIDEARRRAALIGVDDRVEFAQGDMTALPFADNTFDLIWCEGAAYIMGVEAALRSWRGLLKPGGRLALSEAVWLRPDAPESLRQWWGSDYPAMGDVENCRGLVGASGYELLGDFVLPQEAWWEHYYEPMAHRLEQLEASYAGDSVAEAVLSDAHLEIANYREYAQYYGYVFIVLGC